MKRRRLPAWLLFPLAALLALALAGPAGAQTAAEDAVPPPPSAEHPFIVIYSERMMLDVDPRDAQAATQFWIESLVKKRWPNGTARTLILSSVDAIANSVRAGAGGLLILLPEEYLRLRDRVHIVPIFSPVYSGKIASSYGLLVRRDGPRKLSDLRGKRVMLSGGGRGGLQGTWLNVLLRGQGLPLGDAFFGEVREAPKSSRAVLSVFFGQTDACVVDLESFGLLAELNPQLRRDLVSLHASPEIPWAVICATTGIWAGYRNSLQNNLMALQSEPRGRQLLTMFRSDRLIPFEPNHLQGVARLLGESAAFRKTPEGKR